MVMQHSCILDHRIVHALSFQILPHGYEKNCKLKKDPNMDLTGFNL